MSDKKIITFSFISIAILIFFVIGLYSDVKKLEAENEDLKIEYRSSDRETKDLNQEITFKEENIDLLNSQIEYYEILCNKFGLLVYSKSYPFLTDFAYLSSYDNLLHSDYFCNKIVNTSLSLVNCDEYPNNDFCDNCIADSNCLLDPQTKLYHKEWQPCAPHATSDYKTISFKYIISSEKSANANGYSPCTSCFGK